MTPAEVPDALVEKAKGALDAHRWKSMGVSSVECECGEILHGDASLTAFPADAAFLEHVTRHALAAVLPEIQAQALEAEARTDRYDRPCEDRLLEVAEALRANTPEEAT